MNTTPDQSLHETLTKARERLVNIRNAVSEAEKRAEEAEAVRLDAEKLYVAQVAEAMATGEKTPAKSAALRGIQEADDIADSALDFLKKRISQCDSEVKGAAWALAASEAKTLVCLRAAHAESSCNQIIPAFATLVRAIGINDARAIIERVIADGGWVEVNTEHYRDAEKISCLTPEVHGVGVMVDQMSAEIDRPRRGTIGDRVTAFVESRNRAPQETASPQGVNQ